MSTTNKLTPEMRAFLADLADLMERYGVELNVEEGYSGHESYVSGIEVYVDGKWRDGERLRDPCDVVLSRSPTAGSIRKFLEAQP